jgi:hypothetical protein
LLKVLPFCLVHRSFGESNPAELDSGVPSRKAVEMLETLTLNFPVTPIPTKIFCCRSTLASLPHNCIHNKLQFPNKLFTGYSPLGSRIVHTSFTRYWLDPRPVQSRNDANRCFAACASEAFLSVPKRT